MHPELVGLPAKEGWNIELVFVAGIMHRRVAAVRVEPLWSGPASIFGYRLGWPALRVTCRGALRRAIKLRYRPRRAWHRWR